MMNKEEAIDIILGVKSNTKWKIFDWKVRNQDHNVIFYNGTGYILCSFETGPGYPRYNSVDRKFMESVDFAFHELGEMTQTLIRTRLYMKYESPKLSKWLNPFGSVFEHIEYGQHEESNKLQELLNDR